VRDEDARREQALRELGLKVVRFKNDEVVKDAERSAVVGKIGEMIQCRYKKKSESIEILEWQ
jgi:very-short-patch-repair endonuclease